MRDTAFLLAIVLLGGSLVFVAQRAADAGESLASARAELALRKGEAKRQDARTEKQERLDSIAVRSKELMDVARAAGLTGTTDGQKQYEIGFSQGIKLAELQGELLQTRSQTPPVRTASRRSTGARRRRRHTGQDAGRDARTDARRQGAAGGR